VFAVGRIVKPFGIRGEVIVRPITNSPERFNKLKRVFIGRDEQNAVSMTMTAANVREQGVRVSLDEVKGRNEAEGLVGSLIFVSDQERGVLPPETYLVDDVVGMIVVDQSERVVGKVKEVLHMPANDVYVVERNGREMMIPAVKEFIKKYDLNQKKLHVHLIEGMEPDED